MTTDQNTVTVDLPVDKAHLVAGILEGEKKTAESTSAIIEYADTQEYFIEAIQGGSE